MKTAFFSIVIGIVLFSGMVIAVLYAFSDKPLKYGQGFIRKFDVVEAVQKEAIDLHIENCYVAGMAGGQIYIGSEEDTLGLMAIDTAFNGVRRIGLSIQEQTYSSLLKSSQARSLQANHFSTVKLRGSFVEIDSPYFFIKAGYDPGIFKGRVGDWRAERIANRIPFFSNAVHMRSNSFAFTVIGAMAGVKKEKQYRTILAKVSDDGEAKFNATSLEAQVDSLFSTMGTLRFCRKLNRLVFTYAYRNQYVLLDTTLVVTDKGNTVDTISHVHIKPMEVEEDRYSLASTPAIVNSNAQIYGDLLFVKSNIMASNENKMTFDEMSVIDVYDLSTRAYRFSFYVPSYKTLPMSNFRLLYRDRIVVLFDHHAVLFSLNASRARTVE